MVSVKFTELLGKFIFFANMMEISFLYVVAAATSSKYSGKTAANIHLGFSLNSSIIEKTCKGLRKGSATAGYQSRILARLSHK